MTDPENGARTLLASYAAAAEARDVDGLVALYVPDVRVFDAFETWFHPDRSAWRDAVVAWLGGLGDETVTVSFENVDVRGGGDFAVVSALVAYTGLSATGERLRAMDNRLTWGISRFEGGWRILHEHTSAPITFPDMTAALERPRAEPGAGSTLPRPAPGHMEGVFR